ncbi:MAG: RagB/SusD family nutrient uptake outer membrane protein [Bacteroidales bacterium]|nr:RagB/SusD family nutrient uptake outer membrane protein [Bacteroidales bacterium]
MFKNKYIKALAISVLAAGMTSCDDVLDVNREDVASDTAIWSSVDIADMYITASYKIFTEDTQLKNCRNRFWDSYSDIMKSSSWDQYGHPYNSFLLQGISNGENGAGALECWSTQYNRIRTANDCLRGLREFGSKFGSEVVVPREAEIRLCRAYSYWLLARVYGGVILRTEKSGHNGGLSDGAVEADIHQPRATEAETYRYILDELKFAAENLPDANSSSWLRGRATKPFAYGLISRVALYAHEWEEAAEAAEKCGAFSSVQLDPDFSNLFSLNAASSPEVLFAIEYLQGNTRLYHLWDSSVSPGGDTHINNGGAYAEHQPTAELADLYEWNDGTPFSWDNWSVNHADPFSDREPRFQATILYNGAQWRGRKIETFEGGLDGFMEFRKSGSTGGKTCTGYFLRKFLIEDNMHFVEAEDKSVTPDLIMRYAEVLLNQAEAYAQADLIANQAKILDCINKVRARVNLPAKTIADVNTLDNTMKLIREERAKELAAEGLRFWDLRRWDLAEGVIGGQMAHGVKVNVSGGAPTYERISCDAGQTRIYPVRYKYFSIPLNERTNNNACVNNPGW